MNFELFAEHELLHLLIDYTEIFLGVAAVVGVVFGFSKWLVKKIEAAHSEDEQLQEIIEGQKKLDKGMSLGQKKLEEHMEEENKVRAEEYKLIQESIDTNADDHSKIFTKIDSIMENQQKSKHRQVQNTLAMVKSLYTTDDAPVLIYKVDPQEWRAVWCNIAWTKWTGLSLEETRAGGDLKAIKHDEEREIIEPTVTRSGRAKQEMNVEYTLQNPVTHEEVGVVQAHAELIDPENGEFWYYVARLVLIEE
jgi:hypothetical protein